MYRVFTAHGVREFRSEPHYQEVMAKEEAEERKAAERAEQLRRRSNSTLVQRHKERLNRKEFFRIIQQFMDDEIDAEEMEAALNELYELPAGIFAPKL